jgi:hypothetical protein
MIIQQNCLKFTNIEPREVKNERKSIYLNILQDK